MISLFIEATLRSLLVALAVAVGLRMLRVRNVPAQKAAWGLVLVSALAMPLLLPISAQWHLLPAEFNIILPAHPMTLLEELQARIQAKSGSGDTSAPRTALASPNDPQKIQEFPTSEQAAAPRAKDAPSLTARTHRPAKPELDALFTPDNSASSFAQPSAHRACPVSR